MKKIPLGLLSGTILGVLDGLSAIPNPHAQPMLATIIISATIKGLITGGIIGVVSQRLEGIGKNILMGLGISTAISFLAAVLSETYLPIIIPGAIIGLLLGLIVSKWGKHRNTA